MIPNIHSGLEYHYNGINRDLNNRNNNEIWYKSYDLLTQINNEKSSKLRNIKKNRYSVNSMFSKEFFNDLSLYKEKDKHTYRSRSRQNNEDSRGKRYSHNSIKSRSNSNRGESNSKTSVVSIMKKEENKGDSYTKPKVSFSLFKNRDVLEEMFRLLFPKSYQTDVNFS